MSPALASLSVSLNHRFTHSATTSDSGTLKFSSLSSAPLPSICFNNPCPQLPPLLGPWDTYRLLSSVGFASFENWEDAAGFSRYQTKGLFPYNFEEISLFFLPISIQGVCAHREIQLKSIWHFGLFFIKNVTFIWVLLSLLLLALVPRERFCPKGDCWSAGVEQRDVNREGFIDGGQNQRPARGRGPTPEWGTAAPASLSIWWIPKKFRNGDYGDRKIDNATSIRIGIEWKCNDLRLREQALSLSLALHR